MTPLEPLENAELSIKDRLASKGMTPEQLFSRSEILAMTKEHIEALSPILRTVFVLRVVLEFTAKESAEILDVPPNTVKARLWRARRQLAGRISRIHLYGIRSTQVKPLRAVSTGAACSSGAIEPSHVLTAMGLRPDRARASIRFSLGKQNTAEDVEFAIELVPAQVARLRELSPLYNRAALST
jgi:hypothetical protein